uniref:glucan endo-1,3-beta-D-glucosidase n=1 Tax=Wollemia nobilis TaxID=56998 RepID=A0A0C9RPR6_9CONI
MPMPRFVLFWVLVAFCGITSCAYAENYTIGVNYGQLGNNLPPPQEVIPLIQKMKAGMVKIYDTNPEILKALAHTGIKVSVMVKNEDIANVSASQPFADSWVKHNVAYFYPTTRITTVLVGNEILSQHNDNKTWYQLVPAMRKIRQALLRYKLHNVRVSTPSAMEVLNTSFPPSSGAFRDDIAESVIKPMLKFLNRTKSAFFIDVYPYFAWSSSPNDIAVEYANFGDHEKNYTDPNGLVYTNMLDQQLDALVAAMAKLGYEDIKLTIAETGWPNAGDLNEWGANIFNAAHYNRRLVRRMLADPPLGTPRRPNQFIPVFIFSVFNENQKPGPGTERHWGLLYPNGSNVYDIDLTGKLQDSQYKPLPSPPPPYRGKLWCVADLKANVSALPSAIEYACGQGNNTCVDIQPGKPCYAPNSIIRHASYAFNSYWQQFKNSGGTCYFDGAATMVTKDPSYGSCTYPYN